MRFGEEEHLEETRAKSTDETEVTGRVAEVKTGRGSASLVQGGVDGHGTRHVVNARLKDMEEKENREERETREAKAFSRA